MRPAPPRGLLIAGLAAIALLFAWFSWRDLRSESGRVERLMQAQAQSIMDLATEGGSHGYDAYQLWEREIAARLLDNARWVARLDSIRPLTTPELARFARLHGLGRINLFDARGEKVASSVIEAEVGLTPKHEPRDFFGPVLRGETRELLIGFKPARFKGGSRFAVAVVRRGGGVVVVNVFADSMQAVLERVRPSHLLQAMAGANGVRYVVLQTRDSVLVSAPDHLVGRAPDPAVAGLEPGGPALVRERPVGAGRVYEVARAVTFPGVGPAVLRVGLDAAPLEQARGGARERALVRGLATLLFAALVAGLTLFWQRQAVLAAEVRTTRLELEASESERERTARLAAMGELAAHVAHEIRNPLNTIHMIAQQTEREEVGSPAMKARAADMRAESQRIETIVQQFLEFARPRPPQLERVALDEVVGAAGRAAQAACAAAGIVLEMRAERVAADVDPLLLKQILDNLLRNAREASPPGGRIRLVLERAGREALISVEDQGAGVPDELRERIFDLYFSTKPEGSGLGLSLAAQMASALGGGIRLEDAADGGARFVVRLPIERGS